RVGPQTEDRLALGSTAEAPESPGPAPVQAAPEAALPAGIEGSGRSRIREQALDEVCPCPKVEDFGPALPGVGAAQHDVLTAAFRLADYQEHSGTKRVGDHREDSGEARGKPAVGMPGPAAVDALGEEFGEVGAVERAGGERV